MSETVDSAKTVTQRYREKAIESKEEVEQDSGGHQLIKHVLVGQKVSGVYYLKDVYEKKARNGNTYTDLVLCDKSGSSFVRYWGKTDLTKGIWVMIDAKAEEYAGQVQIVIQRNGVNETNKPSEMNDYMPVSPSMDADTELLDKIRQRCEELAKETGDSTCYLLAEDVLGSAKTFGRFIKSPYGTRPHYGVVGGLLSHTACVAQGVLNMAEQYGLSAAELQVALCAAILHAVGAVDAYNMDECVAAETEYGVLLGTGALTMTRLSLRMQSLREVSSDTKPEMMLRIMHCVASCTDSYVQPMTKEALVLHQAYKADMEIVNALDFIVNDENTQNGFTAYDSKTGRRYYKGERESPRL